MKNIKKLTVLLITMIATVTMTACGTNVYESHQSGYTLEDSVKGVTFDVPDSLISQATAVTAITDDMADGSWLYKNGADAYLAYNMKDCVIMVQAGTNFDFENAKDVKSVLKEKGVNSVYFNEVDRQLNYTTSRKNDAYKIVFDVNADLSITPDIFGVFTGKLAVVSDGENEYSLFIGVPGNTQIDMDKKTMSIIDHIAASLTITGESPITDVENDADGGEEEKVEEEKTEEDVDATDITNVATGEIENVTTEEVEEETDTENEGSEASTSEDSSEKDAAAEVETDSDSKSSDEKDVSNKESSDTTTVDSSKSDEATKEDTAATEEIVELELEEVVEKTADTTNKEEQVVTQTANTNSTQPSTSISSSVGSNQKQRKVRSSLYSMALVGETTFVQADTYSSEMPMTEGSVTINRLISGKEAVELIKKAYKDKALLGEYEDAPVGTSYEVIEYTTSIDPTVGYIDIRMEGLDGNNLKHQGIEYGKRTNDILGYVTVGGDGRYEKCYCFYAVPNGCKEYLIEMGSFLDELREKNAYYDIKRN